MRQLKSDNNANNSQLSIHIILREPGVWLRETTRSTPFHAHSRELSTDVSTDAEQYAGIFVLRTFNHVLLEVCVVNVVVNV